MSVLQKLQLINRYIRLFPRVRRELEPWKHLAAQLPAPLREQAQASLKNKEFHCIGGAVYALYPGADTTLVLRAVVALQTISDYLDNLCDRLSVTNDKAFRRLHQSFLDALMPGKALQDYYRDYPYQEETYLPRLVMACQEALAALPQYAAYQPAALRLGKYYCELQSRKHAGPERERMLLEWIDASFPREKLWQEWAAAAGSTLGIFALFALSSIETKTNVGPLLEAYFPYIQALHILLDYLIDQEEDRHHGDLNFTFYYSSPDKLLDSLKQLVWESHLRAENLPHASFHHTVIDGLIALYGSDPKVRMQKQELVFKELSRNSRASYLLPACAALRRFSIL